MKKEIVVSGCSFTCPSIILKDNWYYIEEMPKLPKCLTWADLMNRDLNIRVVNLAKQGTGNLRICKTIQDYVIKNHDRIEFCIAALTEWDRFEFVTLDRRRWGKNKRLVRNSKFKKERNVKEIEESYMKTYENFIDLNLRNIYELQSVCKKYNIKCIFFSMLNPIVVKSSRIEGQEPDAWKKIHIQLMKYILNNKYFDMIEKDYLIGWPFFDLIGGYNFHDKYILPNKEKYTLGKLIAKTYSGTEKEGIDPHPNEAGHKFLYENLKKELKRIEII